MFGLGLWPACWPAINCLYLVWHFCPIGRLPAYLWSRLHPPVRLHAGLQPDGRELHPQRGAGRGCGIQVSQLFSSTKRRNGSDNMVSHRNKVFFNIARITARKNRDEETLNENDYS
jgi:hypothetical protein